MTKFSKTRTNSFRVLQELISTLVNTTLLIKTIIFNILFFCCHSFLTYFFTSQGLCGEVIGTIVKTTLNQVTVKLHEILHLHAHSFRYQLMYVSFSSCFFLFLYLLVLNHGSNLSLFSLVETREIHVFFLLVKFTRERKRKKKVTRVYCCWVSQKIKKVTE